MTTENSLKRFRKRNNWKQEDLAEKLGINQQNISTWESGETKPKYPTIIKLFKLGAEVEDVFDYPYKEKFGLVKAETTNNEVLKQMQLMEKRINARFEVIEKTIEKKKPLPEARTA
jgi:transcriptional regulator with XRE-family HTH domain